MKKFAAQYIITASGSLLKRGIITCTDDGTIVSVTDTGGEMPEEASTQFYNGIIIPGFVNCHSHIELSDMKGITKGGAGLGSFIKEVREKRNTDINKAVDAIRAADRDIYRSGTSALADICNTSLSFGIKDESPVHYINLLEVFGINPGSAFKRIDELKALAKEAALYNTPHWIVPHSFYSLSESLLSELSSLMKGNELTSVHFLESPQERQLLDNMSGDLMESYRAMGITEEMLGSRAPGHINSLVKYLPGEGNLLLVHNTFATREDISVLTARPGTWWCLCPNSNLYIENSLPPVMELISASARIVLGTDSLASITSINPLEELKTLQREFPVIGLAELVRWASANGAMALGIEHLGTIEPGKRPGLVLIENCDLQNLKLTADSSSKRLI